MGKKIKNYIKKNAGKLVAIVLASTLVAGTTVLKDNVHFGSVVLKNPKGDHYIWGTAPKMTIRGENFKGNLYAYGLLVGENKLEGNINFEGNLYAYGLFAGKNHVGGNSNLKGNMFAGGLIAGENSLENNSHLEGNMYAHSLMANFNKLGNESP